jgi:hypothetical protein
VTKSASSAIQNGYRRTIYLKLNMYILHNAFTRNMIDLVFSEVIQGQGSDREAKICG